MNRFAPLALTFIALGIILFLKLFGEITAPDTQIYGNMLLFCGIVSVFVNMGKQRKGSLFLGVFSFMIGVLFYVMNNFDIMSTNRIILPALFFVFGSGFLFIYLDDLSEITFLIVSVFLMLAAYFTFAFYDSFESIRFSASISKTTLDYWEYLFIIIGVGIITDRRI